MTQRAAFLALLALALALARGVAVKLKEPAYSIKLEAHRMWLSEVQYSLAHRAARRAAQHAALAACPRLSLEAPCSLPAAPFLPDQSPSAAVAELQTAVLAASLAPAACTEIVSEWVCPICQGNAASAVA